VMQADDAFLEGRTDVIPDQKVVGFAGAGPVMNVEEDLAAGFQIMEQIRMRVDQVVKDPKTAEALKPYYPYACKRPAFHDEFLPTFNLPHVHLVDTAPTGVTRINEKGPVHNGKEYPVDVLIYATGFQFMGAGTFNRILGKKGESLAEKWERQGTKTFLGVHSRDFPNLFIVNGPQGGGGVANGTTIAEGQGDYLQWLLTYMRGSKLDVVECTEAEEEAWALHCAEADIASAGMRDCFSYYNAEGAAKPGSLGYYGTQWGRRVKEAKTDPDRYLEFSTSPQGYVWEMEKPPPARL